MRLFVGIIPVDFCCDDVSQEVLTVPGAEEIKRVHGLCSSDSRQTVAVKATHDSALF